jgi:sulfofructose kinase
LAAPSHHVPRILCTGVAVLDEVFRVDEVPPTDSKTNASAYVSIIGGNASNAAVAISRLGGRASFAGPLGDNDIADRIIAGLERENIDHSGCVRATGTSSSVSAILINDAGERTIATFRPQKLLQVAPPNADALVADVDCILADNRTTSFVTPICLAAQAKGLPVVMDVDGAMALDHPLLATATHIIFSAESLRAAVSHNDLEKGLCQAHARLGQFVAVTDGLRGALWYEGGEVQSIPAFQVKTVDTLGAGDVFHGAFALAASEGRDARFSMRFAAAAAALKCEHFGGSAAAPTRAVVDAFLAKQK